MTWKHVISTVPIKHCYSHTSSGRFIETIERWKNRSKSTARKSCQKKKSIKKDKKGSAEKKKSGQKIEKKKTARNYFFRRKNRCGRVERIDCQKARSTQRKFLLLFSTSKTFCGISTSPVVFVLLDQQNIFIDRRGWHSPVIFSIYSIFSPTKEDVAVGTLVFPFLRVDSSAEPDVTACCSIKLQYNCLFRRQSPRRSAK